MTVNATPAQKKVSFEVSTAFEATSALLKGKIKGEQVTGNYMMTHFENNAVVAMAKPRIVPGPFAISHGIASFSYDLFLITFFFFMTFLSLRRVKHCAVNDGIKVAHEGCSVGVIFS